MWLPGIRKAAKSGSDLNSSSGMFVFVTAAKNMMRFFMWTTSSWHNSCQTDLCKFAKFGLSMARKPIEVSKLPTVSNVNLSVRISNIYSFWLSSHYSFYHIIVFEVWFDTVHSKLEWIQLCIFIASFLWNHLRASVYRRSLVFMLQLIALLFFMICGLNVHYSFIRASASCSNLNFHSWDHHSYIHRDESNLAHFHELLPLLVWFIFLTHSSQFQLLGRDRYDHECLSSSAFFCSCMFRILSSLLRW